MLVAVGIFFIYEMFTVGDFGIAVNWNFFTSAWFWPLFVIGLVLAIVFWGKFGHWGGQPYDVYEDSNGNKVAKRNDDVVENCKGHMPHRLATAVCSCCTRLQLRHIRCHCHRWGCTFQACSSRNHKHSTLHAGR